MLLDLSAALLNIILIAAIIWFIVLIIVIIHLVRRRDIMLPVKIFWGAVLFFAPVVGLIFYLIYGATKRRQGTEIRKR